MEINNVKWDSKGLTPAVIQDDSSMNVLMIGYMNSKSLEITISIISKLALLNNIASPIGVNPLK